MYVNGEWKDAENQEKRTIINPANGEVISYAPEGTIEDASTRFMQQERLSIGSLVRDILLKEPPIY